MAVFFVTFSLGKRKGYLKLLRRLEHCGARRVLPSVWALEEDCTAEWLRDDLTHYVDEDCRLLVVQAARAVWSGPIVFDPRQL